MALPEERFDMVFLCDSVYEESTYPSLFRLLGQMKEREPDLSIFIFYEDRGVSDLLLNYIHLSAFSLREHPCSNRLLHLNRQVHNDVYILTLI